MKPRQHMTRRKKAAILAMLAIIPLVCGMRLALAAPPSAASNQEQQLKTLTKMVEELLHRVDALEQKLGQVEKDRQTVEDVASKNAKAPATETAAVPRQTRPPSDQPPGAPLAKQPVTAKASPAEGEAAKLTPKESWARLEDGMTKAQVLELLGPPATTFKLSGQTVWYYYYRDIGTGSVFFYDDGHVASRQKPPFSAWHW